MIFSKKFVKENPKAVQGFLRAINKAIVESIKDPKASVAAVLKREPLIKMDVELERFDATIKEEMNHPEIATLGLGDIDDARMKKAIDILVDANKLPRTPAIERNLHPRAPAAEGGAPAQAGRREDELTSSSRGARVSPRPGVTNTTPGSTKWTWD